MGRLAPRDLSVGAGKAAVAASQVPYLLLGWAVWVGASPVACQAAFGGSGRLSIRSFLIQHYAAPLCCPGSDQGAGPSAVRQHFSTPRWPLLAKL